MVDAPKHSPASQQPPSSSLGFSVAGSAQAPFVYFEAISSFGLKGGIGKVALTASRQSAASTGGTLTTEIVHVGHLVGSIDAIKDLRKALDGILLLAEPPNPGSAN